MDRLRRFDASFARFEGHLATVVLVAMVGVAFLQAVFFNFAERGVGWAVHALESMRWADTFLQKGTLWLAFLGASLATHDDKHIAIDVLTKVVPGRVATAMHVVASLAAGVVAFVLAAVFYQACLASDAAVPFDYEVLTDAGPTHVCDAPAGVDAYRPAALCLLRGALAGIGVPVSSGAGVAQLIVPVMFVVIGLRFVAKAGALAHSAREGVTRPDEGGDR